MLKIKKCKVALAFFLAAIMLIGVLPIWSFPKSNNSILAEGVSYEGQQALPFRELSADQLTKEMGVGWNLGNTLDGHSSFIPGETVWQSQEGGAVTTQLLLDSVHNMGFNTVRIPITWGKMIEDENDYKIKDLWLNRVQQIIDYAIKQDMYAVINMHHDGAEQDGWIHVAHYQTNSSEWDKVKQKFGKAWEHIAERFKNYDEHLIFEAMNEVKGGADNSEQIKKDVAAIMELNQIFTDKVRSTGANNTKRWLAVSGRYTNIGTTTDPENGFALPDDPINSANKFMVSVHDYPWPFGMGNMDSVTYSQNDVRNYATSINKLVDKFTSKGIPILFGEYGATDKNNTPQRAYFYEAWNLYFRRAKVVGVAWDNTGMRNDVDDQFAIINRVPTSSGLPAIPKHREIIDAIMRGFYSYDLNTSITIDNIYQKIGGTPTTITTVTPITAISFDKDSISLNPGQTHIVETIVTPQNSNDPLIWESANASVATVYNGMIRAKGFGRTTITAYAQSSYGKPNRMQKIITVTVSPNLELKNEISAITLDVDKISLNTGDMADIGAILGGAEDDYLMFVSTNAKVCTVNSVGIVSGITAGTAYIYITSASGLTKTVEITVEETLKEYFDVSLGLYYLSTGATQAGPKATVNGNGTYTVYYDLEEDSQNMSTNINGAGAIFIKDSDVLDGNTSKSPVSSANIKYNKITVSNAEGVSKELTLLSHTPKSALKGSIFDTNDPINVWDGSLVSTDDISIDEANYATSFIGIDNPTKITVEFELSDVVFVIPSSDGLPAKTMLPYQGNTFNIVIGQTQRVQASVENPMNSTSVISFVSSDSSVAVVKDNTAVRLSSNKGAMDVIGVNNGTSIITAMSDSGKSCTFTINVSANKTALQSKYNAVKDISKGYFSDASYNLFVEKLTAAQTVLNDIDALQAQVNLALDQLIAAHDALAVEGKGALTDYYDDVKDAPNSHYTADSYNNFKAKLDVAKTVIDNTAATQVQIDTALAELQGAYASLVLLGKSVLQIRYDDLKDLEQGNYTTSSFNTFTAKLIAAKAILDASNTNQEQINTALNELNVSFEGLILVDKSALQSRYDEIKNTEKGTYTEASYNLFIAKLNMVKTVLDNEDATQSEVDTALNELNSAYSALKKASKGGCRSSINFLSLAWIIGVCGFLAIKSKNR